MVKPNDFYKPHKEHGVTVSALGFGNTHKHIQFDADTYKIANIDFDRGMITLEKIQNSEKK